MKKLVIITILALFSTTTVVGQWKEFTSEVKYRSGDSDSPEAIKKKGIELMRADVLNQAGVYVTSESNQVTMEGNGKFTQTFDEKISTVSGGIVKLKFVKDTSFTKYEHFFKGIFLVDTSALLVHMNPVKKVVEKPKAIVVPSDGITIKDGVITLSNRELFVSVVYSSKRNLLYTSTSTGRILVFNDKNVLVDQARLSLVGKIFLDYAGELGAITDDRQHKVAFFNQSDLMLTHDALDIPHVGNVGGYSVWFTSAGYYVSSFKSIFLCTATFDKLIEKVTQFSILDYDFNDNRLLLGEWDNKVANGGRKVHDIYVANVNDLNRRVKVLTTTKSIETKSMFTNYGYNVVSYDEKGNYYDIDLRSGKVSIDESHVNSGLGKVNENMFLITTGSDLLLKKSFNGNIDRTITSKELLSINKMALNTATGKFYYVAAEYNNKLISLN